MDVTQIDGLLELGWWSCIIYVLFWFQLAMKKICSVFEEPLWKGEIKSCLLEIARILSKVSEYTIIARIS